MTQVITISKLEQKRVAGLAYEGKVLRVMLCSVGSSGFTADNSVANWQTVELSGNGYVRFSATIGNGSYIDGEGAYVLPDVDAVFTASSLGYIYDRVVSYIDGATHVHSVIEESPAVVLAPGQNQTYRLSIRTDD